MKAIPHFHKPHEHSAAAYRKTRYSIGHNGLIGFRTGRLLHTPIIDQYTNRLALVRCLQVEVLEGLVWITVKKYREQENRIDRAELVLGAV